MSRNTSSSKRTTTNEERSENSTGENVANSGESGIINTGLTEDEKAALTSNVSSISYTINEKLRSGIALTDEEKRIVDNWDNALKKLPKFEGTVYRSLDSSMIENITEFWALHQSGNVVQYSAYTSSALVVYDQSMDLQCVIKCHTGRDITAFNPNEQEVLFGRNANFIIIEVKDNKTFMEEV